MLDISSAGHLSAGDDSLSGAIRELKEELNLDVDKEELQFIKTLKCSSKYTSTFINNEFGFLSSNYHEGVNGMSIIYCLNKLIEEGMDIKYKIVKINYDHLEWMKQKVIDMIKNGYMAIVNVGPNKNIFFQGGHYITVTSVNNNNQEFYVANSCNDGDKQIDITFSYEQIVKDIYKDNFDFLMIRKRLI